MAQPLSATGAPDTSNQNTAHSRTYQACIPCRRRKVRCDLGPVDNPHEPPCVRCRRESKECFFSATRRKRRAADSGALDDEELDPDELEYVGGRKRLKPNEAGEEQSEYAHDFSRYPLVPGAPANRGRASTGVTSDHTSTLRDDQNDEQVNSQTAAILQNAEVHSGHDALNVLLEAATHHRTGSTSSNSRPKDLDALSPRGFTAMASPMAAKKGMPGFRVQTERPYASPSIQPIDPAIRMSSTSANSAAELTSALKAWSRFKFVRSGWFTAKEGIDYVNYFYTKLSPLTPIVMPDYSPLASHATLLRDEPMLAVTVLTIASRHMKLAGDGSHSRPYAIHQKLWSYLEGMINRLVWGQEQFNRGGNVYGSSAQAGSDVNPYTRSGLRILGTVESLMLLTEWHPRSMHFPPQDDDSELLLPDPPLNTSDELDTNPDSVKGIGGQRIDTWLEPCWRSDRICWMLLSMAMSLAFEIGVFDEDTSRHMLNDRSVSEEKRHAYEIRRLHVKNLLLVYTTQTSGRIGLTSMMPPMYSEPGQSELFHEIPRNSTKDLVIHLWLRIASIMKSGNKDLFPNRATTRELLRSGRYKDLLIKLHPQLAEWRRVFNEAQGIPDIMRHVLTIEHEYARVYLNSLALQAVVERCTMNTPKQHFANPVQAMASGIARAPGAIPPATLERWYGGDRLFINEVIDGCRGLLGAVVDGLYPGRHLKHAPVRTYFRIISVAIILLKTFALGATEADVAVSLGYLDRTIEALRSCIVDDVHVASRFADLLDTLTARIRARFVRMARPGASRAASNSPTPQVYSFPPAMQESHVRSPMPNYSQRRQMRSPPQPGSVFQQAAGGAIPAHAQYQRHASNNDTGLNPLSGISTQAYDFSENGSNFLVMPPPTNPPTPNMGNASLGGSTNNHNNNGSSSNGYGYSSNNNNNNGSGSSSYPEFTHEDWLALPLDSLLNSSGGDVTQNGYGPGVGEYDMLELLLNGQAS